jgi:hypothetical protein
MAHTRKLRLGAFMLRSQKPHSVSLSIEVDMGQPMSGYPFKHFVQRGTYEGARENPEFDFAHARTN